MGGRGDLGVSRFAFVTLNEFDVEEVGYEAEDQMMGMEVNAVIGGGEVSIGAVSWDFGGSGTTGGREGVGCEIDNDFGDDRDAKKIGFGGHVTTGAKG